MKLDFSSKAPSWWPVLEGPCAPVAPAWESHKEGGRGVSPVHDFLSHTFLLITGAGAREVQEWPALSPGTAYPFTVSYASKSLVIRRRGGLVGAVILPAQAVDGDHGRMLASSQMTFGSHGSEGSFKNRMKTF